MAKKAKKRISIRQRVKSAGMILPHGYEVRRAKRAKKAKRKTVKRKTAKRKSSRRKK